MNYYLINDGVFAGCVVGEYRVLDIPFCDLDDDLQVSIRDWAESQIGILYNTTDGGESIYRCYGSDKPLSMDEIKEDYEESWDSSELSDEEFEKMDTVILKAFSEQYPNPVYQYNPNDDD